MNVEELLVGNRWDLLNQVICNDLWNESAHDLIVTSLTSATHRGDRLPPNPDAREGYVLGQTINVIVILAVF